MIFNDGPWLVDFKYVVGTIRDINRVPMLYRASRQFAYSHLKKFPSIIDAIKHIPRDKTLYKYESIDLKVTMLNPGWYPCIPGWHLDDFWRKNGQPALEELDIHGSIHYMFFTEGGDSSTQFMIGPHILPPPSEKDPSENVYGYYNRIIESDKAKIVSTLEPNRLYMFKCIDFHRGTPAKSSGWRIFFRLTQSNHRVPFNQIRQQVQVYIPFSNLESGW